MRTGRWRTEQLQPLLRVSCEWTRAQYLLSVSMLPVEIELRSNRTTSNRVPQAPSSASHRSTPPPRQFLHTGRRSSLLLISSWWARHRQLSEHNAWLQIQPDIHERGYVPSASSGSSLRLRLIRTIAYGCWGCSACGGSTSIEGGGLRGGRNARDKSRNASPCPQPLWPGSITCKMYLSTSRDRVLTLESAWKSRLDPSASRCP